VGTKKIHLSPQAMMTTQIVTRANDAQADRGLAFEREVVARRPSRALIGRR
jgi:hypothetical protein